MVEKSTPPQPLSPPKKEKEDTTPVELILYQSLAALMNSNNILYLMQVLASLQILDYIIVAFLPGISEVISKEKCFYHFCVFLFLIIVLLRVHCYMCWFMVD